MPGDFDFLNDDTVPKSKPPRAKEVQPIVEPIEDEGPPRAEAVDDQPLTIQNDVEAGKYSARSAQRPTIPERSPKNKHEGNGSPKRKRRVGSLLLAASGVLVLGSAVTLLLVYRSKEPDAKDKNKGGNVPVAAPIAAPQAKKEVGVPGELSDDVLARLRQSTVLILQWRYEKIFFAFRDWVLAGEGSGFIIEDQSKSRLIVTNAHVVGRKDPKDVQKKYIRLVFKSGMEGEFMVRGEVEEDDVDVDNDLAVIRPTTNSDEPHVIPAPLRVMRRPILKETQKLWASGFPQGIANGNRVSIRESSISSFRTDENGKLKLIQCEKGTTFGNSGGPFVDAKGDVVGVAVSRMLDDTINFAIPSDRVLDLLDRRWRRRN